MSTMGYVTTLTGAEDAAELSLDFTKQSYKVMVGGKQVVKNFPDVVAFIRSTSAGRWSDKGVYEMVPANTPRFDYDPLTKALRGLLLEEQSTNMVSYSDRPIIQTTRSSYIVNGELWIDGTTQFKKLVEDTSTGTHFGLPATVTIQPDTTYTFSYFLKAAERTKIQFQPQAAANWVGAVVPVVDVDLVSKTVVSSASAITTLEELGDGVFRVTITMTSKGAAGAVAFSSSCYPVLANPAGAISYAGDGLSGMYIGGYQVEAKPYATSYVPCAEVFTSRYTPATYFDSKGVLKTAGINVPRSSAYTYNSSGKLTPIGLLLESASVNLLPNSSNFTANAWGAYSDSGATVTTKVLPNREISPSGDMDASLLVMGSGNCLLTQNIAANVNLPYTMSVWMKGVVGGEKVRLEFRSVTSQGTQWGSPITLTKDWIRYTVSGMNSSLEGVRGFQFRKNAVDGGEQSFYIWGAQIEQSTTMSSYIATGQNFVSRASTATYFDQFGVMQTAPINTARSEAYSRTGVRIGLLVESSAATNFVKYSNCFGSGWTDTSNSPNKPVVTGDSAVAPDGTNTATTIEFPVKDANTTQTWNQQVGQLVTGATLAPSVWLKADKPVTMQIRKGDGVAGYEAVQVTTEWQRFESTPGANTGTTFNFGLANPASLATTPFKLYAWGAQLEYGNYATSEIVTGAVAVTRAADVYSSPTATRAADVSSSTSTTRAVDYAYNTTLSTWFNQSKGTFVVSGQHSNSDPANKHIFGLQSSNSADSWIAIRTATQRLQVGGTTNINLSFAGLEIAPRAVFKAAFRYGTNNGALFIGGVSGGTDSSCTFPSSPVFARAVFGGYTNGSISMNGWLKGVNYYKTELTNDQLAFISN